MDPSPDYARSIKYTYLEKVKLKQPACLYLIFYLIVI